MIGVPAWTLKNIADRCGKAGVVCLTWEQDGEKLVQATGHGVDTKAIAMMNVFCRAAIAALERDGTRRIVFSQPHEWEEAKLLVEAHAIFAEVIKRNGSTVTMLDRIYEWVEKYNRAPVDELRLPGPPD